MSKDFQWVIVVHWTDEHESPAIGPFGLTEAENLMREARKMFRSAGLKPPKMGRRLLRSGDNFIPMIMNSVARRVEVTDGG